MKGWIDLKTNAKWLKTLLILVGVALFALATVGESIQRANWSAIGGYVDDIAGERGYDSYDAIDDLMADDPAGFGAQQQGVFDLSGRRVAASASARLPRGLYVIDGRKVLVK